MAAAVLPAASPPKARGEGRGKIKGDVPFAGSSLSLIFFVPGSAALPGFFAQMKKRTPSGIRFFEEGKTMKKLFRFRGVLAPPRELLLY
jgi:hypothetical protein